VRNMYRSPYLSPFELPLTPFKVDEENFTGVSRNKWGRLEGRTRPFVAVIDEGRKESAHGDAMCASAVVCRVRRVLVCDHGRQ
jgi:hypothetical protein